MAREERMTWIQKMCSSAISCGRVPEHVAFIMDGNRRYAKKHKIPSFEGHAKGFDMLVKLMRWCSELGIREITAYAFSIANFKRSTDEVNDLMELCKQKFEQLLKDKEKLKADDVQYRILGRIELIPRDLRNVMAEVVLATKENGGLTVNIAFAYAARDDILQSVRQAVDGVVDGRVAPSHVTHELLSKALYTNESSIPDLVIRTSGEFRYSDFLLWQVSCSCLYITDALWPDLTLWNLIAALLHYQRHYQTLKDVRQLETQRIVKIANAELEDLIDRFGKSAVKKHNDWLFGQDTRTASSLTMATSVIYKLLYLADSARLLVLRLSHGARGRIGGILGDNSDTGTAIRRALGSKTLDHLAVILSKEEVAVADLVRVAVWSRAAGTAHVSFHDPWGRLKARRAALDQALQAAGLDPCRTAANATAVSGCDRTEPHTAAGGRLPCVTLLDMADGKAAIARAARGLCERALVGELTSAGVSMELLDGCIVRGVGVPAPELAVCCGDVISLCGFLPWHASFTTFLLLPSLRNLSLCGFVSLLDKFSQCEQRGGA